MPDESFGDDCERVFQPLPDSFKIADLMGSEVFDESWSLRGAFALDDIA